LPLSWARGPHSPDRDRFCGATKNRKVPRADIAKNRLHVRGTAKCAPIGERDERVTRLPFWQCVGVLIGQRACLCRMADDTSDLDAQGIARSERRGTTQQPQRKGNGAEPVKMVSGHI